jgi:hypothetical protein
MSGITRFFADPAVVTAETYPSLRNISVGFMVSRVTRALEPARLSTRRRPSREAYPIRGHQVAS